MPNTRKKQRPDNNSVGFINDISDYSASFDSSDSYSDDDSTADTPEEDPDYIPNSNIVRKEQLHIFDTLKSNTSNSSTSTMNSSGDGKPMNMPVLFDDIDNPAFDTPDLDRILEDCLDMVEYPPMTDSNKPSIQQQISSNENAAAVSTSDVSTPLPAAAAAATAVTAGGAGGGKGIKQKKGRGRRKKTPTPTIVVPTTELTTPPTAIGQFSPPLITPVKKKRAYVRRRKNNPPTSATPVIAEAPPATLTTHTTPTQAIAAPLNAVASVSRGPPSAVAANAAVANAVVASTSAPPSNATVPANAMSEGKNQQMYSFSGSIYI